MASDKVYSSTFKAQVVQEILQEEKPLTQIASERGVHPKVLRDWKAIALRELPTLFERQSSITKMKDGSAVLGSDKALLTQAKDHEETLPLQDYQPRLKEGKLPERGGLAKYRWA
jgi:transposase-like protein